MMALNLGLTEFRSQSEANVALFDCADMYTADMMSVLPETLCLGTASVGTRRSAVNVSLL